ncbi:Protein YRO2 [Nakaseomyces bracarensis]|uniref:Protein YRO2 n=1 Tax=Nakaseomyces bracarensis TaxID=273131 RepID=A0ABR4NMB7_9SACH
MSTIELFKRGGNEAVKINPPNGVDFHITKRGSDWLFAAFCIFALFSIVFIFLMFRKPVHQRLVYITAIAPNVFMAIAYFTIASNLGWAPVRAKYNHVRTDTQTQHPGTRQIFYARYVGWFMALPWPVIQASMFGNTPILHTAFNCAMACAFTVCFLVASVVHSTYKWGYFTIGCGFAIVTVVSIMTTTLNLIRKIGDQEREKTFYVYFCPILALWLVAWPVCFGISDGGNVLQPDSEAIFYGIIDLIILGFFPALFVPLASHVGTDNFTIEVFSENANAAAAGMAKSPSYTDMEKSPASSPTPVTPKPKASIKKPKLMKKNKN